ncbi:protein MLN51 [Tanacetum coccineum]
MCCKTELETATLIFYVLQIRVAIKTIVAFVAVMRTLGGRKLWELRDEKKWGHDKFEELTTHERHYDEGRRVPRGRNRARGRNRGEDRQFARENRPKAQNNNNQTNTPKSVRGRGPRKYQPSTDKNFGAPAQSRPSAKPMDKTSHASSGRASAATSTSESSQVPVRNNVVASNLNSASPPFYPSGSSNKEANLTQKKDGQTGSLNRGGRPAVSGENYGISQSNNLRGRNVSDSLGMDKLYIDDSVSSIQPNNRGPSYINTSQPPQTRAVGRGPVSFGQAAHQPVPSHNQVNRVSSSSQVNSFQRAPVPNQLHPNIQVSGQQYMPRSASGSRVSSPPKTSGHMYATESTDLESSTESNDSKTALVGKGKGSIPSSGMNSFSYAGAQLMGASGSLGGNHGDQNFPGAPTFFPVMQFAGQHPGGLGVPAVGMAFPGYVGQPNGMGNSEMTWLPVLAGAAGALGAAGGLGAAGALGASYCSPYITMDGAYNARASGQASSLALSSKDGNTNKPGSDMKPSQRPELANDELRQRQNTARRQVTKFGSSLWLTLYVLETPAHAAFSLQRNAA